MNINELTPEQRKSLPILAVCGYLDEELAKHRRILEQSAKDHGETQHLRGQIKALKRLRESLEPTHQREQLL